MTMKAELAGSMIERLKQDKAYRKELFQEIISRAEWKSIFEGLTNDARSEMIDCVAGEMTLDQLTWLLQRLPRPSGIGNGGPNRPQKTSVKTIHVWVIYWLFMDEAPQIPVYVGMTRQLSERWTAHRNGSSETAAIENRENLRIKVVETVCGGEKEARKQEKEHIAAALKINSKLLNKASVRRHENAND